MSMFKLGTEEGGYVFFSPSSFKSTPQVLGSGIRRSINGTARQEVTGVKQHIELGFEYLSNEETLAFYKLFETNILQGKDLKFTDDLGNTFIVMWSGNFGIEDRVSEESVYWSGTIVLEEI